MLLFVWAAAAANIASAQDMLNGEELIDALRTGGYNIYFRHAATDWTRDDHVSTKGDWTSCDPQKMRQLSAQGRDTARQIGEAIKRLGIQVGRVFSSEYCRARETAQHMGLGPVVPILSIMNMRAAESSVAGKPSLKEPAMFFRLRLKRGRIMFSLRMAILCRRPWAFIPKRRAPP